MTASPLRRISVRLSLWYTAMLLLLVALPGALLYLEL